MRRVSVVMPVYNAEPTLRRSVQSVLAQTHRELELVAVDDGSSDASPAMLAAFASSDPRVKVIRQANAGVAAARNAPTWQSISSTPGSSTATTGGTRTSWSASSNTSMPPAHALRTPATSEWMKPEFRYRLSARPSEWITPPCCAATVSAT